MTKHTDKQEQNRRGAKTVRGRENSPFGSRGSQAGTQATASKMFAVCRNIKSQEGGSMVEAWEEGPRKQSPVMEPAAVET